MWGSFSGSMMRQKMFGAIALLALCSLPATLSQMHKKCPNGCQCDFEGTFKRVQCEVPDSGTNINFNDIDDDINFLEVLPRQRGRKDAFGPDLPDAFGEFPQLQRLIIRNNGIQRIPAGAARQLRGVNTLDLAGNDIQSLQDLSLDNLPNLMSLQVIHLTIKITLWSFGSMIDWLIDFVFLNRLLIIYLLHSVITNRLADVLEWDYVINGLTIDWFIFFMIFCIVVYFCIVFCDSVWQWMFFSIVVVECHWRDHGWQFSRVEGAEVAGDQFQRHSQCFLRSVSKSAVPGAPRAAQQSATGPAEQHFWQHNQAELPRHSRESAPGHSSRLAA